MLIEEYFVQLEEALASCPHVVRTTRTKEKRAPHSGFVKGTVVFSQGLRLSIMEFVRTEPRLVKTKYRYHCQDAKGRLLFRYDDAHTIKPIRFLTINMCRLIKESMFFPVRRLHLLLFWMR